eukprot:776748-Rhodomonas_salina.1
MLWFAPGSSSDPRLVAEVMTAVNASHISAAWIPPRTWVPRSGSGLAHHITRLDAARSAGSGSARTWLMNLSWNGSVRRW